MNRNKIKTATLPDNLINFDRLPASAFVRLPIVCALFSIAPATAWRYVKSGKLPAPQKIGERITAWQVGKLRAKQAKYSSKVVSNG